MPVGAVGVEGYMRRSKSGKMIQVKQYRQNRDLSGLLKAVGRPPTASAPGAFANERSMPFTKSSSAAHLRSGQAKLRGTNAAITPPRPGEEAMTHSERKMAAASRHAETVKTVHEGQRAEAAKVQEAAQVQHEVDTAKEVQAKVKGPFSKIELDGQPYPPAKGTKDDPIDVGGDLQAAIRHLAEGRHVRLSQPDEVATLLTKLAFLVNGSKSRGQKAPNINLCNVSVKGANLFCAESKGIPRVKMPQLSGTPEPGSLAEKGMKPGKTEANITNDFREALIARGIQVTDRTVLASHLRASQDELDGPKVAGMTQAMEAGKIPDAGIYVTRDGYIIDGHHRWAAKVAIDSRDNAMGDISMPVHELDMDIGAALDFANEFALAMGIKPKGLGAAADGATELAPEEPDMTKILEDFFGLAPEAPETSAAEPKAKDPFKKHVKLSELDTAVNTLYSLIGS